MKIKKLIVIICAVFVLLFSLGLVNSQSTLLGCCTNPGAGDRICSPDLVNINQCCPVQSSNPTYYKSDQNPQNPTDYNNCYSNFFFERKDCGTIDVCSLGCCCSNLGGTITAQSRCIGTDLTFYKGQASCSSVCAVPQCNDGIDNDNNGCKDFSGGDTGCSNPSDTTESGGTCSNAPGNCRIPTYVPKLTSLEVKPAKGEKRFLLSWTDDCSSSSSFYEIFRCTGTGCTNFALIGTSTATSFEDQSSGLAFGTIYNFQIKAHYNLQASTPTINKTASLGDAECFNVFSTGNFCRNNIAYSCDDSNKMNQVLRCTLPKICLININTPQCIERSNCRTGNPFGIFSSQTDGENGKYCFYDKSI